MKHVSYWTSRRVAVTLMRRHFEALRDGNPEDHIAVLSLQILRDILVVAHPYMTMPAEELVEKLLKRGGKNIEDYRMQLSVAQKFCRVLLRNYASSSMLQDLLADKRATADVMADVLGVRYEEKE